MQSGLSKSLYVISINLLTTFAVSSASSSIAIIIGVVAGVVVVVMVVLIIVLLRRRSSRHHRVHETSFVGKSTKPDATAPVALRRRNDLMMLSLHQSDLNTNIAQSAVDFTDTDEIDDMGALGVSNFAGTNSREIDLQVNEVQKAVLSTYDDMPVMASQKPWPRDIYNTGAESFVTAQIQRAGNIIEYRDMEPALNQTVYGASQPQSRAQAVYASSYMGDSSNITPHFIHRIDRAAAEALVLQHSGPCYLLRQSTRDPDVTVITAKGPRAYGVAEC